MQPTNKKLHSLQQSAGRQLLNHILSGFFGFVQLPDLTPRNQFLQDTS
jgi:hypothetical protein